ncbi:MAG: metallophosphoesterase family protein [Bacteroidota bacterium]
MRKFAISDIHGCFLSFEALLEKIALTTADELYFLGDYIDRGPDSKKVIDKILELKANGHSAICLAGNHDFALLDAKTDRRFYSQWYNGWGGKQTLEGFGVQSINQIEGKYIDFFNSLEMVCEVDDFILVHAGLDFNLNDPLKPDINMLYLRNWYDQINFDWLGNRKIIHGHTPVKKMRIEFMLERLDQDQVLDIDGGCFAKHLTGKGYLCAFEMVNRELFFQKNIDDVSSYWEG